LVHHRLSAQAGSAVSWQSLCWLVVGTLSSTRDGRTTNLARGAEIALTLDLNITDGAQISAAVQAAHCVSMCWSAMPAMATRRQSKAGGRDRGFDTEMSLLFAMTRNRAAWYAYAPPRAHVLNITSVAGFIGFPGSGFYYAASKHAVEGGRTLADETSRSESRSPVCARAISHALSQRSLK
jgi:NAD(P)-dependent dehydrogenase (short-subunit alcohol dehydrogenase family)